MPARRCSRTRRPDVDEPALDVTTYLVNSGDVSLSGSVTAHVLLGLLATVPRHGYELKRAYDLGLPRAKPLAFAQVYTTLARLVRDGFVAPAGRAQAGGPERTSYMLTDAGRAELRRWLDQVEPPAPYVGGALVTKVVMALVVTDADHTRDSLIAQRQAHVDRLRELTGAKMEPDASLGDVIAADFAIAHLDADLRWLETTLARVADLDREADP